MALNLGADGIEQVVDVSQVLTFGLPSPVMERTVMRIQTGSKFC